ncbi:hypothetical protein EZV62_020155 [Acer yangbiense]|uniref:Pentacotripeptide-repeat region of PRORP domain-containing protein n=1 Tax=Acer yangbiense TaxID=1000413 RepID=A0A5C7HDH0_9ROSI|nr:hypothetical protein EZV62_020155 [Acer yangbiense]
MRPAIELATRISRALISGSNHTKPTRTWTPSLEQTLHQIGLRDSLSPSLVARVIDPYLLSHHSLALGFFNWASQQPNFTHSSLSYHSILKSLSFSRQFNAIDSVLKQVKLNKITLDSSVFGSIIGSLIQGKNTQKAFLVFSEFKLKNEEIGLEICNSLLAALASDGYFDSALKVFDEMTQRGVGFSTIGFGVFVWRFCRNAELGQVLSMIDEVKKSHNSVVNGSVIAVLIVHGLCEAKRIEDAYRVLDELRIRECKPDFIAYRIVAEEFKLMGAVVEREAVLKKKRKLGVAPRTNDYREFVLGLISERRILEAKQLGEVIISGNFPIDDDVLNTLIGSVSGSDPSSAIVFFNFMIEKGRVPTLLTLSNLSWNLCKLGKSDELVEIFKVLSANDYFMDVESYNVMVSFLCKAGRVREAYQVFQEMKKKGLFPDVSFYNSLMDACCRDDLLRPAKRLWDEMFASGCAANLQTYNILIRKFSEVGEVEDALRLFHHMLKKGVAPDAITYTSLLEGLCQETKLQESFEVFDKSINQDAKLAHSILSTFTLSLCRKGHFLAAAKLLRGLASDIVHSDSHVILLKCLANADEVQAAIEHIAWIQGNSPSMLEVISNELLAPVSSYSQPTSIVRLLKAVQERCLVPG